VSFGKEEPTPLPQRNNPRTPESLRKAC
jgi:hypothetical protein